MCKEENKDISVTQDFNEQNSKLVDDGDVERVDKSIPNQEYEKKTKRWFGKKNKML